MLPNGQARASTRASTAERGTAPCGWSARCARESSETTALVPEHEQLPRGTVASKSSVEARPPIIPFRYGSSIGLAVDGQPAVRVTAGDLVAADPDHPLDHRHVGPVRVVEDHHVARAARRRRISAAPVPGHRPSPSGTSSWSAPCTAGTRRPPRRNPRGRAHSRRPRPAPTAHRRGGRGRRS